MNLELDYKVKEEFYFLSNFRSRIIVIVSFLMITLSLVLAPIGGSTAQASVILKGVALKSPTNVYDDAKTGANVLKSYSEGSILQYRAHSADWYKNIAAL
jgi:mannosyl-glycoprotein endo-beta-N-acetylglucosaminidase